LRTDSGCRRGMAVGGMANDESTSDEFIATGPAVRIPPAGVHIETK
jgi:hypothetical protein